MKGTLEYRKKRVTIWMFLRKNGCKMPLRGSQREFIENLQLCLLYGLDDENRKKVLKILFDE